MKINIFSLFFSRLIVIIFFYNQILFLCLKMKNQFINHLHSLIFEVILVELKQKVVLTFQKILEKNYTLIIKNSLEIDR